MQLDQVVQFWQFLIGAASLLLLWGASWAVTQYRIKIIEEKTDGAITSDPKDAEDWRNWRRSQEKTSTELTKDMQYIIAGIEEIKKYIYNGHRKE